MRLKGCSNFSLSQRRDCEANFDLGWGEALGVLKFSLDLGIKKGDPLVILRVYAFFVKRLSNTVCPGLFTEKSLAISTGHWF